MAKSRSSRPARSVTRAVGKLQGRSEPTTLPPDACIQAIQNNGWTREVEASLLSASDLSQLAPETVSILVTEATRRNDPDLWRLSAAVAERRNENQDAIRYATDALNLRPNDVEAMTLLAQLYEKQDDSAASVQWHRRIVDIDPQSLNSNRALARFYYGRGEYDTAIQYLGRLLDLEPEARNNKLYWLLATVKSTGLHGLAQPLTRVRRWRNFTEEEESLAHELFVLVGKQCLQTRQLTRARQYLVCAQQLIPSAEIEALLAEIPDQARGAVFDRSITTPVRQDPDAVEHLAAVLLADTRGLPAKVWDLFSSALGIATSLLAVAVLVLWVVPEAPEQRSFSEDTKIGTSVIKDTTREQPPTVIAGDAGTPSPSAPKPVSAPPVEQSRSKVSTALGTQENVPDLTTSEVQSQLTSPSITLSDTSSVPSIPASKPEPAPAARPTVQPPVAPAATVLSSVATTPAAGEKQMRSPITSTQPRTTISPDAISTPTKSTVNAPSSTSSRVVPELAEVARPVVESRPTLGESPAVKRAADASPPVPRAAATSAASTKGERGKASSAAITSAPPRQQTDNAVRVGGEDSPEVNALAPRPVNAIPDTPDGDIAVAAQEQKIARAGAAMTPSSLPESATLAEGRGPIGTAAAVLEEDVAPSTSNTAPAAERKNPVVEEATEAQEKTLTALTPTERDNTAEQGTQALPAADSPVEAQDESVRQNDTKSNSSTGSVLSASPVIARLSSQSPYTSRFPIREKVVSVPPKQLLSTMTALMKRETGASKVNNHGSGVLRARVSGKRPKVSRNGAKTYGQYLVEVLPGPEAGTSRVRAKVIMFDWLTGRPVDDASILAERFLDKVPE